MSTEPSLFSVGGAQSRVAVPLLIGLGVAFATVDAPEVPELVFEPVVELLAGVVLATEVPAAGPLVELEAVAVSAARSMEPTLGATRLGIELEAEAVSASLELPSAPQAARPTVSRLQNRTLRI